MFRKNEQNINDACTLRSQRLNGLREKKRDEMLKKKRRLDDNNSLLQVIGLNDNDIDVAMTLLQQNNQSSTISTLHMLHKICNALGKRSEAAESHYYDLLINNGVMRKMIELLKTNIPINSKKDILFVVINCSSCERHHVNALLFNGIIEATLPLLNQPELQLDIIWTYCNISSETVDTRNIIFENAGKLILSMVPTVSDPEILSKIAWLFSNFCRFKPSIPEQQLEPFINYLFNISNQDNPDLVLQAMTGFVSLCENNDNCYRYATNLIPVVIRYSRSINDNICLAAISCIGSIASISDVLIQSLIENDVLNIIANVLDQRDNEIIRSALWALSNLVFCATLNVANMVCSSGLLRSVIFEGATTVSTPLKIECGWVLINALEKVDSMGLTYISQTEGLYNFISQLLVIELTNREQFIENLLIGIRRLLVLGEEMINDEGQNEIAVSFEEVDAVNLINNLSFDEFSLSQSIQKIASDIIHQFYDGYFDEEDF
ncbi:hypothetical protein ENUP19_0248G0025 [Entamoeba nuttalli]|uniref:Importin alpha, putative n=2 Tax=Entamoeba nuttalli TaxID=412467 RepID=K2GG79_ENTNP|nr:importin alpha, putative [Entamoeba nuttalli P19]EKE41711.1 importin alpha, putative [Entamoeba nuttalli P19]|eukprot:XP_008855936.1 importin alpha, putative [Entamoeba nuttalli P19]